MEAFSIELSELICNGTLFLVEIPFFLASSSSHFVDEPIDADGLIILVLVPLEERGVLNWVVQVYAFIIPSLNCH